MQKGIILTDACPATTDPVACSKVFYGVLKKGQFAALQSYSNLVRAQRDGNGDDVARSLRRARGERCQWLG